jgi:signal transduction histidine kinase
MKNPFDWPSEWDYYLSFSFLFGAVVLRSILLYYQIPSVLLLTLLLLAIWLVLFLSLPAISRRWPNYIAVYLVVQSALTLVLLLNPEPADYFALLFIILSAQIMQHIQPRTGVFCIAAFTPLTFLPTLTYMSLPNTVTLTLVYMAGNALLASYAIAARRARAARAQNQVTLQELHEANRSLQLYSKQLEQLTVARERSRLARELHDSVTQSIFSMTLTAQSARLLLERDPDRIAGQLKRLSELAQSTLAEMQTLISELSPQKMIEDGLAPALRRHIAERRLPEDLSISLEVEGSSRLSPAEEQSLFRIVQESLNNIVKHAAASRVFVRLRLEPPFCLVVQDDGQGFDLSQAQHGGGVGLSSMRERAAEIGWGLQVITSPGAGTCIRLEKLEADRSA